MRRLPRLSSLAVLAAIACTAPAHAQILLGGEPVTTPGTTPTLTTAAPSTAAPLAIDPDAADVKPVTFAIPDFAAATPAEIAIAKEISEAVRKDLSGTGLFTPTAPAAYAQLQADIAIKPVWSDWTTAGAQALVIGNVTLTPQGGLNVQFRLYDIAGGQQLVGRVYDMPASAGKIRLAHKIADDIYETITKSGRYFDSRIAFVTDAGSGGKTALNVAGYDGASPEQPISNALSMQAPRSSRKSELFAYSAVAPVPGKASQTQRTTILYDLATGRREPLPNLSPQPNPDARFAADGRSLIYSRKIGGNDEIALFDAGANKEKVLTKSAASDTAPSLSPDGASYVFVSDRDGAPQLYVARVDGADTPCASGPAAACRITTGSDAYAKPAWSPTGNFIAFEKKQGANAVIGVIKPDGSGEKLLTSASKDASPTWSPNGRIIAFARDNGSHSRLWTIDRSGRNLKEFPTIADAYEPDWGPLLR